MRHFILLASIKESVTLSLCGISSSIVLIKSMPVQKACLPGLKSFLATPSKLPCQYNTLFYQIRGQDINSNVPYPLNLSHFFTLLVVHVHAQHALLLNAHLRVIRLWPLSPNNMTLEIRTSFCFQCSSNSQLAGL